WVLDGRFCGRRWRMLVWCPLNNYTQCPTLAMLSRMPNTGVAIKLQAAERAQLQQWESSHGTPQQVALRCRIILAALAGQDNVSIAVDLGVSRPTVWTSPVSVDSL